MRVLVLNFLEAGAASLGSLGIRVSVATGISPCLQINTGAWSLCEVSGGPNIYIYADCSLDCGAGYGCVGRHMTYR